MKNINFTLIKNQGPDERNRPVLLVSCLAALWFLTAAGTVQAGDSPGSDDLIRLRAWGVPSGFGTGPIQEAKRLTFKAFGKKYPSILPVSTVGLRIPGRTDDIVPFMQIAGDIAPDVLYVNFAQSHTYITKKLLHPLDHYIEEHAGVELADGSALELSAYLEELKKGPNWLRVKRRVPELCWQVIRRRCPYKENCPYRQEWGLGALPEHYHVWAYPIRPLVIGLTYNRELFAEHEDEGIEQRAPRDWEELLRWAKILTNPEKHEYGLNIWLEKPGWAFQTYLYSAGGRVVDQDENGNWRCVMDSEEAVEAAWFFARLRLEKIEKNGKTYRGVLATTAGKTSGPTRYGIKFSYLDDRFLFQFGSIDANDEVGIGPVPLGPTGLRGSELNAMMCGIFSGLAHDKRTRDAAWRYIEFYDGYEARQIATEKMVEAGLGRFVQPHLLQQFNTDGRYDSLIQQVPEQRQRAIETSFAHGVLQPYGKNCQNFLYYMKNPLGAIWNSDIVREAIDQGDIEKGKAEIRRILTVATERINLKMLGNLSPAQQHQREWVAWSVIVAVILIFALVMRMVFRTFAQSGPKDARGLRQRGYRMCYLLIAPAVLSIGLWVYWPVIHGSIIAFQDYSVLGDSVWVGARNFAEVLYDGEFWFSLKVSLYYALMFMVFGFCAPIVLAFLLQEVPRGKIIYRTIYYLPAVLTGVVVIFLWKSFYGPEGMINQVINHLIGLTNLLLRTDIQLLRENWLSNEKTALFCCLLPTIWAGMGPGCLIYLAALKTVPDELYEAADIDGAGIRTKVFHITVPSIKALILINFIGAMIGAVRAGGGFVLAMTGGGPYGEHGGATEVVGLKLFYTTFASLKFGVGAAMAWVLGSIFIGFTVIQLKRLSRLEFRTAQKEA